MAWLVLVAVGCPHSIATNSFRDSRRFVGLAARTLFRHEPPETRDAKLAAIATAFGKVGIGA
ncbi:hypothetical protein [Saccharothrix deserti]|uniref:hypothetical protein n=1 Tax=Saccharothrix deserti TaxID=2593674 RepID=UPI00131DAA30|nr:hypothetical protein [Saccharothrix deserti]